MQNATSDWMWNENSAGFGLHQVELRGRVGLKGAAERCEGKRTPGSIDNHWKKEIVLLSPWHHEIGGTAVLRAPPEGNCILLIQRQALTLTPVPVLLWSMDVIPEPAHFSGESWLLYTCIHRHPKECILAFSLPYTGYQHEMCTNNLQNPKGSIPEEQNF